MSEYSTIDAQLTWLARHNHPCLDSIKESLYELQRLRIKMRHVPPDNDVRLDMPSIGEIMDATADEFGIEKKYMRAKIREYTYVMPRQVAMYLATAYFGYSSAEVGKWMRKHHSTVIYGRQNIERLMTWNARIRVKVDHLKNKLKYAKND